MHLKKLMGSLLILIFVAIVMPIGFTVFAQDTEDEPAQLFIGTVTDDENIFVGMAITGEDVTIYICDGNPEEDTASIAQWFVGTIADGAVAITAANGNSVEAALTEEGASGVFTFTDGSTKAFTLIPAEGKATLYRSEFSIGDDAYVGGWLVLADGTVRGAIVDVIAQTLSPAKIMVIAVSHEIRDGTSQLR